jgi:outer membrane biosynthesis protein TonB
MASQNLSVQAHDLAKVQYEAVGGKRLQKKTQKSDDKKKVQKQDKQEKQTKQDKQQKQQKQDLQDKKKQSKQGGALINDVKNLAVPFAILLAKEGLSKMFKEDAPKKTAPKSKTLSAKSASKTSSLRRRTTMSGGSCNLGCTAQTGGQAAKQLFELQQEIDRFLEKY